MKQTKEMRENSLETVIQTHLTQTQLSIKQYLLTICKIKYKRKEIQDSS